MYCNEKGTLKDRYENGLHGRRNMTTECKDGRTQTRIAKNEKHKHGAQRRSNTKTDCKEGDTGKRIARTQRHETLIEEKDTGMKVFLRRDSP